MAFSLPELVAAAAWRHPDDVALRFGGMTLTYRELDQRIDAVARCLVECGVRRGDRVGVYLDRSFDSVASIFGVMRAGAAYVPFDSAAPPARLAQVVLGAELRCLITEEAKRERLTAMREAHPLLRTVLGLESDPTGNCATVSWSAVYGASGGAPDVRVIEEDHAVIFYTSGSTGSPKGALHSHRSMLSNVEWAVHKFSLDRTDSFPHVTSHHFDLSWLELFATFAAGAALVLVPEVTVKFPVELARMASSARVTSWCSVPSVLVAMVQHSELARLDWSALRRVMFAGERFPVKHLRRLMAAWPQASFCNMYGTSETHIAASYDVPPLESDDPLPIGKACSHVDLVALGSDERPVPPGETGELAIRGPSLMEGYWRRSDLTDRVLVTREIVPGVSGVCYRTGDLVRLDGAGNFHIFGRGDRRVKVRGYLIDLDEVEKILLEHERVQEASAFVVNEDDETMRLEAAVVPRPGNTLDVATLRAMLDRQLPTWSLPQAVHVLADFPRTGSGKIDRKTLCASLPVSYSGAVGDGDGGDALVRLVAELIDEPIEGAIPDDMELLDSGLIGSMAVTRIASFLEQQHGSRIETVELIADNFRNLRAIQRLGVILSQRTTLARRAQREPASDG